MSVYMTHYYSYVAYTDTSIHTYIKMLKDVKLVEVAKSVPSLVECRLVHDPFGVGMLSGHLPLDRIA